MKVNIPFHLGPFPFVKLFILFFFSFSFFWEAFSQENCSWSLNSTLISGEESPTFSKFEEVYDVKFYFLDLSIDASGESVEGSTTILLRMLENADTIAFELGNNNITDSILVGNQRIFAYNHSNDLISLSPNFVFSRDTDYMIKVYYHSTNQPGGGLYKGVSQATDRIYKKKTVWSLSEPFQAKDWFVCKQNLLDKSDSVWVFITTPIDQMAGSNGLLTAVRPVGLEKHRFEWKSAYPMAYYLISFSVSDYVDYSFYVSIPGVEDSILVQNFIYNDRDLLSNEKDKIDATADLLIFFSEIFGPYPFANEKYGHCMAPMGGGMEHQTMTTLVNFNFELVAHELAHQWFGDNVTCASWRDIWVSEGFASYAEYLALENLKGEETARKWLEKSYSLALNYPYSAIYLSKEEAKNTPRIFEFGLTYKKGAAILHMLREEIGNDSLFFLSLRTYQRQFKGCMAVADDFLNVVNSVTGVDYSWFFEQWYYGQGYPVTHSTWDQSSDSLRLECFQFSSKESQDPFRIHIEYKFIFEDGTDTTLRFEASQPFQKFSVFLNKKVMRVLVDPEKNILMKSEIYETFPEKAFFELSPNPFTTTLTIRFREFKRNITIYLLDLKGQLIWVNDFTGRQADLQLPSIAQGMYLILAKDNDGKKYAGRIVKL